MTWTGCPKKFERKKITNSHHRRTFKLSKYRQIEGRSALLSWNFTIFFGIRDIQRFFAEFLYQPNFLAQLVLNIANLDLHLTCISCAKNTKKPSRFYNLNALVVSLLTRFHHEFLCFSVNDGSFTIFWRLGWISGSNFNTGWNLFRTCNWSIDRYVSWSLECSC